MHKTHTKDVDIEVRKPKAVSADDRELSPDEIEKKRLEDAAIVAKETAERQKYFDSRVTEKIKELEKEDLTTDEVALRSRATAIIESEIHPSPNNPTIKQIQAEKASHKPHKQSNAHTHP